MLNWLKNLIMGKSNTVDPAPVTASDTAKLSPIKCGCGRSKTGFCVGLHNLSDEQWATSKLNPANTKKKTTTPKTVKAAKKSTPKVAKKTAKAKTPDKNPAPSSSSREPNAVAHMTLTAKKAKAPKNVDQKTEDDQGAN